MYLINKTPWKVATYEGGWTGIDDAQGQHLFRLAYNNDDNATHAVACVNAFHESGIDPADLPKFVEAVRTLHEGRSIVNGDCVSIVVDDDLHRILGEVFACFPENKGK